MVTICPRIDSGYHCYTIRSCSDHIQGYFRWQKPLYASPVVFSWVSVNKEETPANNNEENEKNATI